jgi:hypothetical protein
MLMSIKYLTSRSPITAAGSTAPAAIDQFQLLYLEMINENFFFGH